MKVTLSACFCLQVLCPCFETNVWGPQSLVWPRTKLLPPVQPTLPRRGRPKLLVSAPRESPGGNSQQQETVLHGLHPDVVFKDIFLFSFQCLKKAIMMESGNYSYWNALGVISMSKGNNMLPHSVSPSAGQIDWLVSMFSTHRYIIDLLLIDVSHRNWCNLNLVISLCHIRSGELCSGSTLLHQVHPSWNECMCCTFVLALNGFLRKYSDVLMQLFNILLQNVVAWTNLGTLYLKKDNIEVCVIIFFFF